jgi:hypothetical protein
MILGLPNQDPSLFVGYVSGSIHQQAKKSVFRICNILVHIRILESVPVFFSSVTFKMQTIFSSSAGIDPFISVFSKYETVDNKGKERKVAGCT